MVLVATKTRQLGEAMDHIRPLIGPETDVVPLLNGVGASDRLAAALSESHALNGICYIFAARVAPGVVRHLGIHPSSLANVITVAQRVSKHCATGWNAPGYR